MRENKSLKIKNIVGIVLLVVAIPLLVINLVFVIKSAVSDGLPTMFGVSPLVVVSGSMEKSIKEGDLIFIGKVDDVAKLKGESAEGKCDGDIITFRDGDSFVTHRIVSVSEKNGVRMFETKGDNNPISDISPVSGSDIVGIYKGRMAGAGSFFIFLTKPYGIVVILGIPILIIVVWEVVSRSLITNRIAVKNRALEQELEEMKASLSGSDATEKSDTDES